MSVIVEYSSNNSGGSWWLSDDDWEKLAEAGWNVHWVQSDGFPKYSDDDPGDLVPREKTGGRWLGALAMYAYKEFDDPADAIPEFERITGQDASAEGCNCCGQPHNFSYTDEDGKYHYASVEVTQTQTVWS